MAIFKESLEEKITLAADVEAAIPESVSEKLDAWTRLQSISISNFKNIADIRIPVSQVTILVGANGCGKSSILQAIHWAARAASYIKPKSGKEMSPFDRLDYIPAAEPLKTAHRAVLKPTSSSSPTQVEFHHEAEDLSINTVTIKIFAARNSGGITAYIEGKNFVAPYKQRFKFITAYIPGLAGLSENETILAQPILRRKAAGGEAGGVLRNLLLNLSRPRASEDDNTAGTNRLKQLNRYIDSIYPGTSVEVEFDQLEDVNISVSYKTDELDGLKRSLETAATGILQVIQIFAYMILFEPKILLIDEPDAHLHADKQERLIETLENAASELQIQAVLTTHSPHVVRAASLYTRIVWIEKGKIIETDSDNIRQAMGWGGLDRKIVMFVEDEEDGPIRSILRQWPDLYKHISICRCFGVDNLPKDKLLTGLIGDGKIRSKIVIHRDQDFMTSREIHMWKEKYKSDRVLCWVTKHSDVEAYFCDVNYISKICNVPISVAQDIFTESVKSISINKRKGSFKNKRKEINRIFYNEDGGSPATEELWNESVANNLASTVGKTFHAAIKNSLNARKIDGKDFNNFKTHPDIELAAELRILLENAINSR